LTQAGHYEWLLDIGEALGVGFDQMGKRKHGCPSTLHFCDALRALYGSDDPDVALAASFAVENWAAAGFWEHLVEGWKGFNARRPARVPVGFWTHHAALEAQHADHTLDELKEVYMSGRICDEDAFVTNCVETLDAVDVFWSGLDARRCGLSHPIPEKDYSIGGKGYPTDTPFGGGAGSETSRQHAALKPGSSRRPTQPR
jgi:pyrroloquinoline quinone (PQQ) biosynthesis protein C